MSRIKHYTIIIWNINEQHIWYAFACKTCIWIWYCNLISVLNQFKNCTWWIDAYEIWCFWHKQLKMEVCSSITIFFCMPKFKYSLPDANGLRTCITYISIIGCCLVLRKMLFFERFSHMSKYWNWWRCIQYHMKDSLRHSKCWTKQHSTVY